MESTNNVSISRRYYCPSDKLWCALMNGYLFIYTGAIKEKLVFEPKVGGRFHIEWKLKDKILAQDNEVLEVIPFERMVFTWDSSGEERSTVTVELRKLQSYCELNLVHKFPEGTDTMEYDWGWDDAMYDLKKHLIGDNI